MFRRLLLPTSFRALVPLFFVAKVAVVALVIAAVMLYLTRQARDQR
jgi:hypothetical protein